MLIIYAENHPYWTSSKPVIFFEDFANKEQGVFPLPAVTWLRGTDLDFWFQNVIKTLIALKTDLNIISE